MKNYIYTFFALALMTAMTGCSHLVTVQTDPPGAQIRCRGDGRPAYKWEWKGVTAKDEPVTFKVPYSSIRTYAMWPDGVQSEIVDTTLIFHDDPVIIFKKTH